MALRSQSAGETSPAVERDLWAAAAVPLACFLDVLLLSLAFLVPDQSALGLGLPLLALATLSAAQLLWIARRSFAVAALRARGPLLAPLVCYLAQAAVGLVVVGGHAGLLWMLAVGVGGLFLNASISAWRLLREPILVRAERAVSSPQGHQPAE